MKNGFKYPLCLALGLFFTGVVGCSDTVDEITNNVLLAELNDNLKAGFGSDAFNITEVQTTPDYLMVKLQRK